MTKEIAKKETGLPDLATFNKEYQPEISSQDILIPRILMSQGQSPQVLDDKAKFGDFWDTSSETVLGNFKNGIEIIPISYYKMWHVYDGQDLVECHPVTKHNENLPWNEGTIKRSMARNFYVLLEGHDLPHIIGMKGKSARTGQALITQMDVVNPKANMYPFGTVMRLSARKESNDNGTFMVLNVAPLRKANQKELNEAYNWFKTINSGKAAPETKEKNVPDDCPF